MSNEMRRVRRTVSFACEGLAPDALFVTRVRGREAISRLFELVIDVEPSTEGSLGEDGADALLRGAAQLVFHRALEGRGDAAEEERLFGMIRQLELLPFEQDTRPTYRLTFVPRIWPLTQNRRTRVYQGLDVPAIVDKLLAERALEKGEDYELKLSRQYRKREYTLQYEESDFEFLCRLLEDEGIFFFFDRAELDCIVFADDNEAFPAPEGLSELPFQRRPAMDEDAVFRISRQTSALPKTLRLFDYNWRNPDLELEASAPLDAEGVGEVVRVGEHFSADGNFEDERARKGIAQIRAQEMMATRERFQLESNVHGARAGTRIGVHQRKAAKLGWSSEELQRDYLVTAVSYTIDQPPPWRPDDAAAHACTFEAIDAATPFRPARITPRPQLQGLTYGVIDGELDDDRAYVDARGRYKVAFAFDPEPQQGKSSCWIRRAQPYAGPGVGMHFPLLPGTEVVIAHIHGDPDRPIIVGAVSNTATPDQVSQKNRTSNVIRTATGVEMRFEDDA
jgi:type VI secretion system secreted protein VgrG